MSALPILEPAPPANPSPATGATTREAAEFHQALQDLIRLHLSRDRERVCCYDLTVSGARAIEIVTRMGPVSLNTLATELFVDKSTASRVVGSLEDRGYLRRAPDPEDRRALRLELTPSGTEVSERLRDDAVWEMQTLLGGFAPEVRRGMLLFLRQLTRTSATHAGATGASCCRADTGAEG